MGRFLIHILAAFAELERAFISERTKDGLANKKKNGVAHTHYPGYGFRWEKRNIEGKWVKVKVRDDAERQVMASIVAWRMGEPPVGWDEITHHLNNNLKLKTKDGTPFTVERCVGSARPSLSFNSRSSEPTDEVLRVPHQKRRHPELQGRRPGLPRQLQARRHGQGAGQGVRRRVPRHPAAAPARCVNCRPILTIGKPCIVTGLVRAEACLADNRIARDNVILFPTKDDWREPSQYRIRC